MRGDPDKPSSRDAFRNFDLTATGLAQEIYKPGPLRDLQLKGGPRMLRWQGGPNLAECHTNAHIQATSPGSQGGRRRDEGSRHTGPGVSGTIPGSGLWAYLGPTSRAAFQADGKDGRHPRQPDFADVASRKLRDDSKLRVTLGPSPLPRSHSQNKS